jgi:hypothetical protein
MNPDVSQIHQEGPFRLARLLPILYFLLYMSDSLHEYNIFSLQYLSTLLSFESGEFSEK